MRQILTLCFVLFTLHTNLSAQFAEGWNKRIQQATPKSPEAAAISKYSYFPVSPSTGTLNVDVPLYTVSQGELKIPISLNYHTGGIRVEDRSSAVGLGWLLNAGGAIVRSEQGLPDETPEYGYLAKKSMLPLPANPNLSTMNDMNFFDFVYDVSPLERYRLDLEPDMFSFNFMGRSGVFYFSQSGKIVSEGMEPLLIETVNNPNMTFRITDENGIRYYFENREQSYEISNSSKLISGNTFSFSKLTSLSDGSPVLPAGSNLVGCDPRFYMTPISDNIGSPLREEPSGVNAWYLSRIEHPNGADIVHFEYVSSTVNTVLSQGQSLEYLYSPLSGGYNGANGLLPGLFETKVYATVVGLLVSKIRFANGEVVFNYTNDRQDLSPGNNGKRLSTILCTNIQQKVVQKIELRNQQYFEANFDHSLAYAEEKKRLRLDKVVFTNASTNATTEYEFSYNQTSLPPRTSYSQDYWGYFNGQTNDGLIPYIRVPAGQSATQVLGNAIRTANETAMKAFSLEKVYYPTGGFTEFYYSPHKAKPANTANNTIVGGLKIDSVRLFPDRGNLNNYSVKRYEYSFNGNIGIGRLLGNKCAERNLGYKLYYFGGSCGAEYLTINSSPTYSMNIPGYSSVEYDKVREIEQDKWGGNNGYTVYQFQLSGEPLRYYSQINTFFSTNSSTPHAPNFGPIKDVNDPDQVDLTGQGYPHVYFRPVKSFYQMNARPLEEAVSVYDKTGQLLQTTTKSYTTRSESVEKVTGFAVYPVASFNFSGVTGSIETTPRGRVYYKNQFSYFLYNIPIGENKILSEGKTTYTPAGPISVVTTYEYENTNGLPRKITTTNSKGTLNTMETWYPFDYATTIPEILSMKNKHIIATPVMMVSKQGTVTTGGSVVQLNGNGQPVVLYDLIPGSAVAHNSALIVPAAGFENAGTVTYSNGRMVSSVLRDGIPKSYLWGYRNSYPVAEAIGATYAQISGIADTATIANSFGQFSDAQVRTQLNLIRNQLASTTALTALYTYSPAIGLTSQTDARGRTTLYEYDGMSRLQIVRDHNSNILKRICYNYYNQPQDCGSEVIRYHSAEKRGSYTRNNCAGTPTTEEYIVPAGKYTSTISQADADSQAQADLTANGQQFANTTGSCFRQLTVSLRPGATQPEHATLLIRNAGGQIIYQTVIAYQGSQALPFTTNIPESSAYTVEMASMGMAWAKIGTLEQELNTYRTWQVTGGNIAIQIANAPTVTYFNTVQTQSFYRNNCAAGYTGTRVDYTVPAGSFSSGISQADANQKALNHISQAGQTYANAQGTCYVPGTSYITLTNAFMTSNFPRATVEFIKNGVTEYTFTFSASQSGSVSVTVPSGTYELRFTVPSAYQSMPFSYTKTNPTQSWSNNMGTTLTGSLTFSVDGNYTITAGEDMN